MLHRPSSGPTGMGRRPRPRRLAVLAVALGAIVLVAGGPALPTAAAATPVRLVDGARTASVRERASAPTLRVTATAIRAPLSRTGKGGRQSPAGVPAGGDPCSDRARNLLGERWQETFRWSYRARSTPDGMTRRAAIAVLKRAVGNITRANNDCGRADRVSAEALFLGPSDRRPDFTADNDCLQTGDGVNAVAFGKLPAGYVGLTCVWSLGDRIVEADIKLDKGTRWAVSLAACVDAAMLEAVATHEFGHAFGMGHVSEADHGRLTMSERLDGNCQNAESTLGAGDLRGLEEMY